MVNKQNLRHSCSSQIIWFDQTTVENLVKPHSLVLTTESCSSFSKTHWFKLDNGVERTMSGSYKTNLVLAKQFNDNQTT